MAQWERDERLARAFVELADTLQDGFFLVDFLHVLTEHMQELLNVTAIGVVMVDVQGRLVDMTASTGSARELEEAQIEFDEGPCKDACRHYERVGPVDLTLAAAAQRWPCFTPVARAAGFATAAAVPLRLREEAIGAVNLFDARPGALHPAALRLAQALADAATIGILHQRLSQDRAERLGQLQTALNSRILVEQAKGALGAHLRTDPEEAFARLRAHARTRRMPLTELCRLVLEGRLAAEEFAVPPDRQDL
ncbi:ANTAR domain-containing protein [Streptomyces sp. NPDC004111]|uniref:ANTAR domain-containing protein n=1 Tax=Streptomyces sp. NPDC004111 TaxID=3364690 RepID=UPI003679B048